VFAAAGALTDPAIGAAGDVDSARVLLRAASGRLCLITNSRRSGYGYDQRIEAFGSGGMIRAANVLEDTVETRTAHGSTGAPLLDLFLTRYADAYRLEMDHFADVFDGAAAAVGLHAGLVALALAEAAEASLRASAPVRPRKIASPI
jgi:myo-inositol 2-dehydrogenase/D-chiro-inositol 1-dehydrogenase